MNFFKFSEFIISHQRSGVLPNASSYPSSIVLDSSILQGIKKLKEFTDQFGYEHSITIFDAGGTVVSTPPIKGSKTDVITRHKFQLSFNPLRKGWFEKQVLIGGKAVFKTQIKQQDISKDPKITPLFNIHSHPAAGSGEKKAYTFFSDLDLKTFLSSRAFCMGLVTCEFLLLCKHRNSLALGEKQRGILKKINEEYSNTRCISEEISQELGFVIYRGRISDKLERIV
ncbi:hypothetical protein JW766_06370 [Candidatus Dojkabacteria bacterium]|nr:hypothetical protein [Candidatus Dojkabacteria bacterium]